MSLRKVIAALAVVALAATAAASAAGPPKAKPSFPVTLKAANGTVTLTKRPTRIVSLSATATETLFAIGAGSQVVAVDEQSNYPATAPKTSLSGFKPNVEAVAGYRPDLVVVAYDANGLLAGLAKLKIPTLMQDAAKTLDEAWAEMAQLGRATGHEREATTVAAGLRRQIQTIVAASPRGRALTVFHELSPDFYSATSSTFIGRIYKLFGLGNVADAADKTGNGYPQLSSEYIVSANPDLIFLSDVKCCKQSLATVSARPGWGQIAAVRNGNIVRLDDDVASRWGPRIVQLVKAVGAGVRAARRS